MTAKTKKIWQTSTTLHPLVEKYTVGKDYLLDERLLPYDLQASAAHAHMLQKMGVLSKKELSQLLRGLKEIEKLWKAGKFHIAPEQEDGHSAIEQWLTEHLGDLGKKIHTGRSRNDQVLVMMRLYMKDVLKEAKQSVQATAKVFAAHRKDKTPLPGYTHMQKAMPATVGMWLGSFADAMKDAVPLIDTTAKLIDQNPLGSASGFGIANFPLKRSETTKRLAFKKTQTNPMYCGLSRGYFEEQTLAALASAMFLAGKFAQDMLLFTMDEFRFFALPPEFTTGSSIMPQKRNYDLFEIMRGNSKVFEAKRREIRDIIAGHPSGYHRDLQLTKAPFLEAIDLFTDTMALLQLTVPKLRINHENLKKAMTEELFVTEKVYELVKQGMSFRDAYRLVKEQFFAKK